MSQSRIQSMVEANVSTAIGFCVSWAITPVVLAAFGYDVGAGSALGITAIYTAVSIVRGYVVRRAFNRIGRSA